MKPIIRGRKIEEKIGDNVITYIVVDARKTDMKRAKEIATMFRLDIGEAFVEAIRGVAIEKNTKTYRKLSTLETMNKHAEKLKKIVERAVLPATIVPKYLAWHEGDTVKIIELDEIDSFYALAKANRDMVREEFEIMEVLMDIDSKSLLVKIEDEYIFTMSRRSIELYYAIYHPNIGDNLRVSTPHANIHGSYLEGFRTVCVECSINKEGIRRFLEAINYRKLVKIYD